MLNRWTFRWDQLSREKKVDLTFSFKGKKTFFWIHEGHFSYSRVNNSIGAKAGGQTCSDLGDSCHDLPTRWSETPGISPSLTFPTLNLITRSRLLWSTILTVEDGERLNEPEWIIFIVSLNNIRYRKPQMLLMTSPSALLDVAMAVTKWTEQSSSAFSDELQNSYRSNVIL